MEESHKLFVKNFCDFNNGERISAKSWSDVWMGLLDKCGCGSPFEPLTKNVKISTPQLSPAVTHTHTNANTHMHDCVMRKEEVRITRTGSTTYFVLPSAVDHPALAPTQPDHTPPKVHVIGLTNAICLGSPDWSCQSNVIIYAHNYICLYCNDWHLECSCCSCLSPLEHTHPYTDKDGQKETKCVCVRESAIFPISANHA